MHTVQLYKKKYSLPSNWKEVPYKICLQITPLLWAQKKDQSLSYVVLEYFIPSKLLRKLPEEYLQPILDLFSWCQTTPFLPCLPKSLWKCRNIRATSSLSITKQGDNLSIIEVAICAITLRQLESEDTAKEAIDTIFYTLARRPGVAYSEEEKEHNQRYAVPENVKRYVVLWFFEWLHDFLKHYHPSIDDKKEEEENEKGGGYGLFPLIYQTANSGTYGTFEQTCLIPAHTIFFNIMISK
jgi:hypothetical protein